MNNKYFLAFAILLVLVLGGAIWFNNQKADDQDVARQEAIENELQRSNVTLNSKYQFKNGKHNFLGILELPSPCHTYTQEIINNESDIEIAFKIIEPESDVVCAQVITKKEFKVTVEAERDANIFATLNGDLVNLNLLEVSPEENIENVEIFIKG